MKLRKQVYTMKFVNNDNVYLLESIDVGKM